MIASSAHVFINDMLDEFRLHPTFSLDLLRREHVHGKLTQGPSQPGIQRDIETPFGASKNGHWKVWFHRSPQDVFQLLAFYLERTWDCRCKFYQRVVQERDSHLQ